MRKLLFHAWKKVKSIFRRKPSPKVQGREQSEEDEVIRMNEGEHRIFKRVALVRGHTNSSPGCSTYPISFPPITGEKTKKVREYDMVGWHCKKVKEFIDLQSQSISTKIFERDGIGMWGVGSQIKKWKADVIISFHMNSIGYKPVTKYREILVLKKHRGTKVETEARRLLAFINKALPIDPDHLRHDKGIKWLDEDDRGANNCLYYERGGSPCFLIEADFVSYPSDSNRIFLSVDGATAYAQEIANFCAGIK